MGSSVTVTPELEVSVEQQVIREVSIKARRTLLLNLPHPNRVIRRYMCSYNAPNFLFPPLELIGLASIVKQWEGDRAELYDAIAHDAGIQETLSFIVEYKPDVIVSISGFETIERDMEMVRRIKEAYPDVTFILFGHYATEFSELILNEVPVDLILQGEPDLIFQKWYDTTRTSDDISDIGGIAYKDKNGRVVIQKGDKRLPDPSKLPMPSYELLGKDHYYEPFLPRPFGMIQTARGCPYQCNYCVKSYGTKLTTRKPEQVLDEIKMLIDKFQIRSLRFIDDTFTVIPQRVIDICKLIIDEGIKLEWSCLSRADTLNEEMLQWMKKAGCKRIYIGVESGSQRILDYYKKRVDVNVAMKNIKMCAKLGIETTGFFLVGMPEETREDLEMTIDFAIKSDLTFVTVSELMPYPGTPFYELVADQVDFSLLPYSNKYKDPSLSKRYIEWEKEFYWRFYFRPKYIAKSLLRAVKHPVETVQNGMKLLEFLIGGQAKQSRKDFF